MKKKSLNKRRGAISILIVAIVIVLIVSILNISGILNLNILSEGEVLDSSHDGAGRIAIGNIQDNEAQSFTVVQIGQLTKLQLKLSRNSGATSGNFMVEVSKGLTEMGPFQNGYLKGVWSIPITQISGNQYTPGWIEFIFPTEIGGYIDPSCSPGQTLYIHMGLSATQPSGGKVYLWSSGRDTDPYVGGSEYYSHDGTPFIPWTPNYNPDLGYPFVDHSFKIYGLTENHPPNTPTIPSGPTSVQKCTSCVYSYSTSSSDQDSGDTLQYRFDFQDGMGITAWSSQSTQSGAWTSVGTYYVKAQAKDNHGAESSWSQALAVTVSLPPADNRPPTAPTVTGPDSIQMGTGGSWTATATDPDGNNLMYYWTIDGNWYWTTPYVPSGTAKTLTYAFSTVGYHSIGVRARDSIGLWGEWTTKSIQVTTSEPPPPEEPTEFSVQISVVDSQTYSAISDATVQTDEGNLVTNWQGIVSTVVGAGTYTWAITKTGYQDGSVTFTVVSSPVFEPMYLTPIEGGGDGGGEPPAGTHIVTIQVYDESTNNPLSDVSVLLGNESKFTDASGKATFIRASGTYTISISKVGYDIYSATVSVMTSDKTVYAYLSPTQTGGGGGTTTPATPGFEIVAIIGALAIAMILFRWRKKEQ